MRGIISTLIAMLISIIGYIYNVPIVIGLAMIQMILNFYDINK